MATTASAHAGKQHPRDYLDGVTPRRLPLAQRCPGSQPEREQSEAEQRHAQHHQAVRRASHEGDREAPLDNEEADGHARRDDQVARHQARDEQEQRQRGAKQGEVVDRERRERVEQRGDRDTEECHRRHRVAQRGVVGARGHLELGRSLQVGPIPLRHEHGEEDEQRMDQERAPVSRQEPGQFLERARRAAPRRPHGPSRREPLPERWALGTEQVAPRLGARGGHRLQLVEDPRTGVGDAELGLEDGRAPQREDAVHLHESAEDVLGALPHGGRIERGIGLGEGQPPLGERALQLASGGVVVGGRHLEDPPPLAHLLITSRPFEAQAGEAPAREKAPGTEGGDGLRARQRVEQEGNAGQRLAQVRARRGAGEQVHRAHEGVIGDRGHFGRRDGPDERGRVDRQAACGGIGRQRRRLRAGLAGWREPGDLGPGERRGQGRKGDRGEDGRDARVHAEEGITACATADRG